MHRITRHPITGHHTLWLVERGHWRPLVRTRTYARALELKTRLDAASRIAACPPPEFADTQTGPQSSVSGLRAR